MSDSKQQASQCAAALIKVLAEQTGGSTRHTAAQPAPAVAGHSSGYDFRGFQCFAKVCDTSSGNRMEASPNTLTGCASALILPHDTASSGRAPARAPQQGRGHTSRDAALLSSPRRWHEGHHWRGAADGLAPWPHQRVKEFAPESLPSYSWAVEM